MKLTIQNLERLNVIGDSKSAFMTTNPTVFDDKYEMIMQYEGYSWNVVLYRDVNPLHHKYRIFVQLIGTGAPFETTAIDRAELSSAGLTLSIIESLMNNIIKKVKA
jgi:hypothetical protein